MGEPPRSVYRFDADEVPITPATYASIRPVAGTDDAALGRLIERAYAGTIDEDLGDNDDGAVEIADWRAQSAVANASVVAVVDDQPVAAALVRRASDGTYWIGYVFTDPDHKARGLGTAVVAAAVRSIREDRGAVVLAGITDGNTASERLFATLGFVRVGAV